jgi:excisionase family DNA binding protein
VSTRRIPRIPRIPEPLTSEIAGYTQTGVAEASTAIGENELITSEEVAAKLRTTVRFVRRLVAERRIEYVKVGRAVRFRASAVDQYIERNRVAPMSRAELRRLYRGVA